jgi:hypothetical protein
MKNDKQLFYWFNNKELTFVKAYGKNIKIGKCDFFILENNDNTYSVIESKTGSFFSSHISNKKEAIYEAEKLVNRYSEKLDGLIQDSIDKTGISPLHKQEIAI